MDDVQATKLHTSFIFWGSVGGENGNESLKMCGLSASSLGWAAQRTSRGGQDSPASPPDPLERSAGPLPWVSWRPMQVPFPGKGRPGSTPQGPLRALTQNGVEVGAALNPRAPACLPWSPVTQAALVRPPVGCLGPSETPGSHRMNANSKAGRPCCLPDCPSSSQLSVILWAPSAEGQGSPPWILRLGA